MQKSENGKNKQKQAEIVDMTAADLKLILKLTWVTIKVEKMMDIQTPIHSPNTDRISSSRVVTPPPPSPFPLDTCSLVWKGGLFCHAYLTKHHQFSLLQWPGLDITIHYFCSQRDPQDLAACINYCSTHAFPPLSAISTCFHHFTGSPFIYMPP